MTTTNAALETMLAPIRAEHPNVTITVNPTPEDILRDATRRYAPEVAEALDAGDVQLAAKLLVMRLEVGGWGE